MKFPLTAAAVALVLAGLAPQTSAHHSFAAEYDANKPVTLKGTFQKMDWINPHSWIYVEVAGPDGKVETWACETGPPNGLYRQGWRRNSLKPGDAVTVEGYMAKDGSKTMNARSVVTAEGRRMFAGSSGDGAPQAKP